MIQTQTQNEHSTHQLNLMSRVGFSWIDGLGWVLNFFKLRLGEFGLAKFSTQGTYQNPYY